MTPLHSCWGLACCLSGLEKARGGIALVAVIIVVILCRHRGRSLNQPLLACPHHIQTNVVADEALDPDALSPGKQQDRAVFE